RRRTTGRKAALAATVLGAGYLALGWAAAARLTSRARPPYAEPPPPGYAGLRLRASDGLGIGAWWRAPEGETRAVVVLAHGNGASRAHLVGFAEPLVAAGCAVLLLTLRAHGDSDGEANDIGLSARHDVEAGVRHAQATLPGTPVGVLGLSLGAAAAVFAAESLGDAVDAYVLIGPYADLRLAVRRRTERYLPPVLGELAYGALLTGGRLALPDVDRIRPALAARGIPASARVLVIAGEADDRAPPSDARAIADGVPQARVATVPGMGHEDLGQVPTSAAWAEVLGVLLPRNTGP
ncbi:MAG: alpha/beta fold hydrolase, partial [Myxococcota bacterium]